MIRYAVALLIAAVVSVGISAQQAQKLEIGAKAPNFSDLPNASSVGPKTVSLKDFSDKDVLVVAITCNHCPVAVAYEDRMVEFAKKYAGKDSEVAFVAINVNNLEADKLPKMKERAEQKGFNYPYLYDESQTVGRQLNAKVTPEFYVFNKNRELVYWGSMDDSQNSSKVSKTYLADAVEAALKGEAPEVTKTRAFGCSVKYER